jgi:hypothetical protein
MMWRCCHCNGVFDYSVGFVVQDDWSSRMFNRSCYTCHWFSFRKPSGAHMCADCTDIPCEVHAPAFARSVALEYLLHSRQQACNNIPHNAPVSQKEHEFSQAIERKKLQDYASHRKTDAMETETCVFMEPTMVERTVMDYAKENSFLPSNPKRRASEFPQDARGRCMGCHAPVEICTAYCRPCFLMSPEGRAKRAKMCFG